MHPKCVVSVMIIWLSETVQWWLQDCESLSLMPCRYNSSNSNEVIRVECLKERIWDDDATKWERCNSFPKEIKATWAKLENYLVRQNLDKILPKMFIQNLGVSKLKFLKGIFYANQGSIFWLKIQKICINLMHPRWMKVFISFNKKI